MKNLNTLTFVRSLSLVNLALVHSVCATTEDTFAASQHINPITYKIKKKSEYIKIKFKVNKKLENDKLHQDSLILTKQYVQQAFNEAEEQFGKEVPVRVKVKNKEHKNGKKKKGPLDINSVASEAFSDLPTLHGVWFGSIPILSTHAIVNCPHLENLEIGGANVCIQANMTLRCPKLKTVKIGGTGIRLSEDAFKETSVQDVLLGGSGILVGTGSFADCSQLTNVNIGGTGISVAPKAFMNSAVENLEIGGTDITIGEYAFENSSVRALEMGGVDITVGTCAFLNCKSLTTAVVSGVGLQIDPTAFTGCDSLTNASNLTQKPMGGVLSKESKKNRVLEF